VNGPHSQLLLVGLLRSQFCVVEIVLLTDMVAPLFFREIGHGVNVFAGRDSDEDAMAGVMLQVRDIGA